MEDKPDRLDEFFRKSLSDFRPAPPPGGWQRFAKGARKAGLLKRRTIFRITAWIAGTITLTTVAVLLMTRENPPAGIEQKVSRASNITRQNHVPLLSNDAKNLNTSAEFHQVSTGISPKSEHAALRRSTIPEKPVISNGATVTRHKKTWGRQVSKTDQGIPVRIIAGDGNTESTDANIASLILPVDSTAKESPDFMPEILTTAQASYNIADSVQPVFPEEAQAQSSFNTRRSWETGLKFCYHFDQSIAEVKKHSHSLMLEASLVKSNFTLTGGAGVCMTNGDQQVKVMYNEYLGTYNRLDSITFNWDVNRYHLIPTYYTSETFVYDSSVITQTYYISNRYTYLRIPLTMSYKLLNKNNFTSGIKAGAEMSFFIDSQHRSGTYSSGLNKVIYQVTEDNGMKYNDFYLFGSLFFDYNINRRLTLSLEPIFMCRVTRHQTDTNSGSNRLPLLRVSAKIKL